MLRARIKITKDELVFDGQYLQMIRRHFTGRTGKPLIWEMTKRKNPGRIVSVIGVTKQQEAILVQIYRLPSKLQIIELPAGLIDPGEHETTAARREFLEETGYEAKRVELLAAGPFDTGRAPEEIAIYLARNVTKKKKQALEDAEDIKVLKIPLKKMYAFLSKPPRGVKIDIKLFGVLYLLQKKGYNI